MPKSECLHRYKKVNIGRDGNEYLVYRCIKPTCNHYIPIALADGRLCECDRCHEPMLINKAVLQGSGGRAMARPHCPNCVKSKKDKTNDEDVAAIAAFLEGNKT